MASVYVTVLTPLFIPFELSTAVILSGFSFLFWGEGFLLVFPTDCPFYCVVLVFWFGREISIFAN